MYAIYVVLTVGAMLVLFNMILAYAAHETGKTTVAISALAFIPAIALLIILLSKWKKQPENVFLLISVPALSAFGLFLLPDNVPDEIWHIYRILSIEDPGSAMIVPAALRSDLLPNSYSEFYIALNTHISWSDTMLLERDMSSYLTHLYLIPGLIAKICMIADVNPLIVIYISRFINAALFAIGGYWVIRALPMAKVCACVYLLNPMLIQQEASCSADAVLNIVALLFIAFIVRARFADTISKKAAIGLVVLYVLTALSKFAYFPLGYLFLLFVPRIQAKQTRMTIYIATAGITVLGGIIAIAALPSWGAYEASHELVSNPPEFLRVMTNTLIQVAPTWYMWFYGSDLGYLNIHMWQPCVWTYMTLLLFSIVFNLGERLSLTRPEKIGLVSLFCILSTALILIFRQWGMEYDNNFDVITGVQGRYFLPYAFLIPLSLSTPRASLVRENCLVIYSCILLFIFAVDSLFIMRFFL